MPKIQRVVGIAFIKDGELLTCKSLRSSKRGKYTLLVALKKEKQYYKQRLGMKRK